MKSNAAKKAIGVLKEWSIVLALILVWAVLSFLSPHFLQWSNISNIFLQSSHIMMCAIGMTFILIGGQMDLSIGSVEALSGTICAQSLVAHGAHGFLKRFFTSHRSAFSF
jgi:ribose transport system permease protein